MEKVGVIGSGQVGKTLADGFLRHGYQVMRGSRRPELLAEWSDAAGQHALAGTPAEAAQFGDLCVLAVKGSAAEAALDVCGAENLRGKVVIDATNPIAEGPPENGVVRYFTTLDGSLMERLQFKVPGARFVKAFSSVGNGQMVNPDYGDILPTMFICGNDNDAKKKVETILSQFGWETADMGKMEAARAIEPLCMLWCIPGFLHNQWTHSFKLLTR